LGRGIQGHIYFLNDYLALFFNFCRLKPGVDKNINQHVEGRCKVRLSHFTPVYRQFFIGSGIDNPSNTFDSRADFSRGGTFPGAFKTHMLDEVRDARLFIGLISGAGADKETYRYRAGVGHGSGYETKSII
jgi:hypothetical protein